MFRNKRFGVLVALVLVALMLAASACGGAGAAPATTPAPRQASVVELKNEVNSRETANADWLAASLGQPVFVGGGVRTGDEARARVDISDGAILRLGASTEFVLAALSPEPTGATTQWTLVTGKVWTFVSEALGGGTFEIETPSGSVTVRGSYLGLEYAPAAGQTVATCLEGQCRLTGTTGKFTDLTTGQQAEIAGAGKDPSAAHPMDADKLAEWAREFPEAGGIVGTITPAPPTATPIPTVTPAPPTATPTPTLTPRPPDTPTSITGALFAGQWQGVDAFDGSTMTLVLSGGNDVFDVTLSDSLGLICNGDPWEGTGTAKADGNFLNLEVSLTCLSSPDRFWGTIPSWIFEYEPSTDTIYEICSAETKQKFPGACDAMNRASELHRIDGG